VDLNLETGQVVGPFWVHIVKTQPTASSLDIDVKA
jgi:hypothetical protein